MFDKPWTTADLTADLAGKLRADRFLVAAEAVLSEKTLQRADLLAMHRTLNDRPMMVVEIKTARSDLLGDLRREKWRGYLNSGAVVFAFPAYLADPKEIPTEAGVIVRIAQGWSWKRPPRWAAAPRPTAYLYRRMALTASDQSAEKVRAEMTPKAADLYRIARKERLGQGRMLAEIAADVGIWKRVVEDEKGKFDRLSAIKRRLEVEINELAREKRRMTVAA